MEEQEGGREARRGGGKQGGEEEEEPIAGVACPTPTPPPSLPSPLARMSMVAQVACLAWTLGS